MLSSNLKNISSAEENPADPFYSISLFRIFLPATEGITLPAISLFSVLLSGVSRRDSNNWKMKGETKYWFLTFRHLQCRRARIRSPRLVLFGVLKSRLSINRSLIVFSAIFVAVKYDILREIYCYVKRVFLAYSCAKKSCVTWRFLPWF